VLRLVRTEARLPRAAEGLSAAGEGSSAAIRKGRGAAGYLLASAGGVAAGLWLGSVFFSPASDASIAMYKRATAFVQACETAGVEISRLRRAAFFTDDCSKPIVTPIYGEEGQLIVRRTVEGRADDDDGGRMSYSVKMDGRGVNRWHAIEIKRVPSHLTLDASLLPTTRATVPASAQR
jgi:hypothetical protein